jgi:hypothetical protein
MASRQGDFNIVNDAAQAVNAARTDIQVFVRFVDEGPYNSTVIQFDIEFKISPRPQSYYWGLHLDLPSELEPLLRFFSSLGDFFDGISDCYKYKYRVAFRGCGGMYLPSIQGSTALSGSRCESYVSDQFFMYILMSFPKPGWMIGFSLCHSFHVVRYQGPFPVLYDKHTLGSPGKSFKMDIHYRHFHPDFPLTMDLDEFCEQPIEPGDPYSEPATVNISMVPDTHMPPTSPLLLVFPAGSMVHITGGAASMRSISQAFPIYKFLTRLALTISTGSIWYSDVISYVTMVLRCAQLQRATIYFECDGPSFPHKTDPTTDLVYQSAARAVESLRLSLLRNVTLVYFELHFRYRFSSMEPREYSTDFAISKPCGVLFDRMKHYLKTFTWMNAHGRPLPSTDAYLSQRSFDFMASLGALRGLDGLDPLYIYVRCQLFNGSLPPIFCL